jgi:nicotinic acid mononucleotide adenylyltransferase
MSTKLGRAVHTYDLLNNIKQKYEGSCFSMVVGGDVLLTIHTWGNSAALQKENPFIIFHRKGYEIPVEKLPPQHTIIES